MITGNVKIVGLMSDIYTKTESPKWFRIVTYFTEGRMSLQVGELGLSDLETLLGIVPGTEITFK